MAERFPQYLSAPVQVLWFETDELAMIVFFFLAASVLHGVLWILCFVGPLLYSRLKVKYPSGFLKHMLYFSGIKRLNQYPDAFANTFSE
ncbi:MAG: type IV conjugative transfer system protein TraL [Thermodesulfobacteriota bacterium]